MHDLATIEAAIRQTQARYTDAVWRKDADAFAGCFTEDGEWRISGMILKGRPAIRETIQRIMDNFVRVLITFRTPILSMEGDRPASRTYIDERCAWKNGETNISVGRYYERFAQAPDGQWLFQWRLFELHYRGDPDMTGQFFDHVDYGPPPAMPPLDATTENMATKRWNLPEGHGQD